MVSRNTMEPTRRSSRRTERRLRARTGPPAGFAALEEGAQSLLSLGARSALGDSPRRLLAVERRIQYEPLCGPHGLRTGTEDLGEDLLDHCVEAVSGRDLVHQADAPGGDGVEALAGQEVASGRAGSDPGQDEGRDHRRDDPELDLREREDGVVSGDADIGAGDEAAPASEGVALNSGHDRSRAAVNRLEHPPQRPRIL